MKNYLQRLALFLAERKLMQKQRGKKTYSSYERAKIFRRFKILIRRGAIDIFLLTLGVFSAGFGLKGFLLPNNFIDGGAVGISLLISAITGISLSILLV